ncbi:MAG: GNAT family N-acetyltransferase [Actinobacteria bacterium]|nr:GNAT family N-acetyltransferase [Actinomycetota bacterium]MBM3712353.1 GNAT family N-acetyltransferase [Actinomycetota bacterium]
MSEINFRVLEKFDANLLDILKKLEIENLGSNAAINEWQIPVIIRYGKFITAELHSGEIIGICEIIREWKECRAAFIHSFYIKEKFRNRGLGRGLLAYTIKMLIEEGFESVELTVDLENKLAVNLYKGFGFEIKEFRPNEYGRGINRHLMILKLKERIGDSYVNKRATCKND